MLKRDQGNRASFCKLIRHEAELHWVVQVLQGGGKPAWRAGEQAETGRAGQELTGQK